MLYVLYDRSMIAFMDHQRLLSGGQLLHAWSFLVSRGGKFQGGVQRQGSAGGCLVLVQVCCFLLARPSPLPLSTAVFSTPVSCMQLSALLFAAGQLFLRRTAVQLLTDSVLNYCNQGCAEVE